MMTRLDYLTALALLGIVWSRPELQRPGPLDQLLAGAEAYDIMRAEGW